MNRELTKREMDMAIGAGLALLLPLLAVLHGIFTDRCEHVGHDRGAQAEYSILGGCRVHVDGEWRHIARIDGPMEHRP